MWECAGPGITEDWNPFGRRLLEPVKRRTQHRIWLSTQLIHLLAKVVMFLPKCAITALTQWLLCCVLFYSSCHFFQTVNMRNISYYGMAAKKLKLHASVTTGLGSSLWISWLVICAASERGSWGGQQFACRLGQPPFSEGHFSGSQWDFCDELLYLLLKL